MKEHAYFDWQTYLHRKNELTEEAMHTGSARVSLETYWSEWDMLRLLHEHPSQMWSALRCLHPRDFDMWVSFNLLRIPQTRLNRLSGLTQTLCSSALLQIDLSLVLFFHCGGQPTPEQIASIVSDSGCEVHPRLPELIAAYRQRRNFSQVADALGMRSALAVRSALRKAAKTLSEHTAFLPQALGATINRLLDHSHATATGASARWRAKSGHIFRVDPACLGEFRVDLADPGFQHIFTARSTGTQGKRAKDNDQQYSDCETPK